MTDDDMTPDELDELFWGPDRELTPQELDDLFWHGQDTLQACIVGEKLQPLPERDMVNLARVFGLVAEQPQNTVLDGFRARLAVRSAAVVLSVAWPPLHHALIIADWRKASREYAAVKAKEPPKR